MSENNVVDIREATEPVENAEVDGQSVRVDQQGNVLLGVPPEREEEMKVRKPTKAELKRAQVFQERVNRKVNKGMSQEQAFQEVQKEDHESQPLPQRMGKIESVLAGAFKEISQEMQSLRHNDGIISEAFDVNYRAIGKMFELLGIDKNKQKDIVEAAVKEMNEAREAAKKAQAEAKEKARFVEEIKSAKILTPDEVVQAPAGATVFGG